jgi:hypothetical protein
MKTTAYLAAMLTLSLSGCASFDAAQSIAADRTARAADESRQTAEWTLCNAISVGAWRRAYAADPARADGWRRLCAQPSEVPQ